MNDKETQIPANAPVKIADRLSDGKKVAKYKAKEGKGFKPTYKFATSKARAKGENFPSKTERVT